jgi:uncharacterized protein YxjI
MVPMGYARVFGQPTSSPRELSRASLAAQLGVRGSAEPGLWSPSTPQYLKPLIMEKTSGGTSCGLASASDPVFARDTFLLQQAVLTLSEEYSICDEEGNQILYVERPVHQALGCLALVSSLFAFFVVFAVVMFALFILMPRNGMNPYAIGSALAVGAVAAVLAATAMRPKRHATFYRDSSKAELLLRVVQDRRFQPISATYTVFDATGQSLARLRKDHFANFYRKRWECLRPDGTLSCVALEQSYALALARMALERVFGYVPTNFIILQGDTDIQIGEFNRQATILNHHVLDLKADPDRSFDRRIALALGVMLDSGERGL